MIVVWVIELFLNQLGQLRDSGKGKTTEYGILQRQFDDFMLHKPVQVRYGLHYNKIQILKLKRLVDFFNCYYFLIIKLICKRILA